MSVAKAVAVKPVWSWDNDACINDLYEVVKIAESYSDVARRIDALYAPSNGNPKGITRNVFITAFADKPRRQKILKAFNRLFPNQEEKNQALMVKFSQSNKLDTPLSPQASNFHEVKDAYGEDDLKLYEDPDKTVVPISDAVRRQRAEFKRIRESRTFRATCIVLVGEPGDKDSFVCGKTSVRGPFCAEHAPGKFEKKPSAQQRQPTKLEIELREQAKRNY